MGPGCNISDGVTIKHPTGLSLGMRVSIHEYTYISASGGVVIGDHVAIGSGCSLISNAHNFDKKNVLIKKQGISQRPIYIGNDVLLGVKVTVLPGVTIGNGAIVGAGSVVTKNIPPYTVNAGVPSRVLRDR
jgi:acetyltransferase-like isoleucine patch superfamily enzyme